MFFNLLIFIFFYRFIKYLMIGGINIIDETFIITNYNNTRFIHFS